MQLLLLLNVVVVACISVELGASRASIFIETLASWAVSRVGLVDREWIHLGVLRALVPVTESVLLHVGRIRMRTLFRQVQLTVHVEIVYLLEGHALLSSLLLVSSLFVIGAALAVGSFLLDDELLSRVCIDLVHLWQLLLLLLLELGLLLLVLFQTLLALIAGELAMGSALGHTLSLSPRARRLRSNVVALDDADVLSI